MDQITKALLGTADCPPHIAAALKEIDENAVLLHLGGTKWWLGTVGPNPKAREILESGKLHVGPVPGSPEMDPAERAFTQVQLEKEYTMYQIMASGFRPIALYDTAEEKGRAPGYDIVEDFRIRDFNWKNQSVGEHLEDVKDATSSDRANEGRIASAAQKMKDKAGEVYDFVFKGRRSVGGGRHSRDANLDARSGLTRVRSLDRRSSTS